MDEDDSELLTYESRNEDQDQVQEDRRTFATSPAEVVVQTAVSESEDETLSAHGAASHDPLAMDTTNPVWNIDLMHHNEYDSMQVTPSFQYQQQPQSYNYNGFNTAVYPVMNEFPEHHDQRQAVGFNNTYWDPFEFGGASYNP